MLSGDISIIKKTIEKTRQKITKGKKPEGNCTYWNNDLSIALRMEGIPLVPYGSPTYEIKTRDGGTAAGMQYV